MKTKTFNLNNYAVKLRRRFHKYPEPAFCEFLTADFLIKELKKLGFFVKFGDSVIDTKKILGLPDENTLNYYAKLAIKRGANKLTINSLIGGKTGVVAEIKGQKEGNTIVAFRFDMDANQVLESNDKKHRPFIENFSSNNNGIMHACGHDGHMAIGLTFARLLSNNLDKFGGTVRLIFQPAEEGVRGGACMIKTVSDVDYLFSGHIGINANDNDMIIVSADGFRTTTKFDLTIFTKNLGHSSLNSSKNDNVLMCSSKIALLLGEIKGNNKFGIVNVGVINCGTARNVIPSVAKIEFETRADDKETNDYLISQINKIIAEITNEFNATFNLEKVGESFGFISSQSFTNEVYDFIKQNCNYKMLEKHKQMLASEDCSYLLNEVKNNGKNSIYFNFGTKLYSTHHSDTFDFDENVLKTTAELYYKLAINYLNR